PLTQGVRLGSLHVSLWVWPLTQDACAAGSTPSSHVHPFFSLFVSLLKKNIIFVMLLPISLDLNCSPVLDLAIFPMLLTRCLFSIPEK
ncbi:hypothetical protein S83_007426, partial [Arachis hypogaea]